MEDLNKIKDRIAKLLAMAADSSSPEEAAIAADRARKLMDKYQVEAWECQKDIAEKFCSQKGSRAYATFPEYLLVLATAVAKLNDCQSVLIFDTVDYRMSSKLKQKNVDSPKRFGHHIAFRGYESDVQMAIAMFEMLQEAMNNQCKAYLAPFNYARYPVKEGTAFKASFAATLSRRINAISKERDEITFTSSGTSLVVAKKSAVDAEFGEVKYQKSKYQVAINDGAAVSAALAGRAAGERQNIFNQVGAENGNEPEKEHPRLL